MHGTWPCRYGPPNVPRGPAGIGDAARGQREERQGRAAGGNEVAVNIDHHMSGFAGEDTDRSPCLAGTMTALAFTRPSTEFTVELPGIVCPVSHTVRYPSSPGGTTVTFREYAAALPGMLHSLCGTAKSRWLWPTIHGPPNGTGPLRVSALLHAANDFVRNLRVASQNGTAPRTRAIMV
jgi:hypothetical protein